MLNNRNENNETANLNLFQKEDLKKSKQQKRNKLFLIIALSIVTVAIFVTLTFVIIHWIKDEEKTAEIVEIPPVSEIIEDKQNDKSLETILDEEKANTEVGVIDATLPRAETDAEKYALYMLKSKIYFNSGQYKLAADADHQALKYTNDIKEKTNIWESLVSYYQSIGDKKNIRYYCELIVYTSPTFDEDYQYYVMVLDYLNQTEGV